MVTLFSGTFIYNMPPHCRIYRGLPWTRSCATLLKGSIVVGRARRYTPKPCYVCKGPFFVLRDSDLLNFCERVETSRPEQPKAVKVPRNPGWTIAWNRTPKVTITYLWLVGNGGMGYNYNYYYYHSSIPYEPKVGSSRKAKPEARTSSPKSFRGST